MTTRPYPVGTVIVYLIEHKRDGQDKCRAVCQLQAHGTETQETTLVSDGPIFFMALDPAQYQITEELVVVPFGEESPPHTPTTLDADGRLPF